MLFSGYQYLIDYLTKSIYFNKLSYFKVNNISK